MGPTEHVRVGAHEFTILHFLSKIKCNKINYKLSVCFGMSTHTMRCIVKKKY